MKNEAAELGARVIAPDRPGFGLSDFKRNRQIVDWPSDVIELADAISIDKFAILGVSGGGPYALVCAAKISTRITNAAICASMGPADAPGASKGTAMYIPSKNTLVRKLLLMGMATGLRRDPDRVLSQIKNTFPEVDCLMLSRPEIEQPFMDSLREAYRSGTNGYSLEASLYMRLWGFRLLDVPLMVHIWHGEDDGNVPISVGRYLAKTIPNSKAYFLTKEGHLSIGTNNIKDILKVLIA